MSEKKINLFKRILPLLISLFIVIIDQISKIIIVNYNDTHNKILESYSRENWIKIIGDWLRIRLGYNNNAIFGLDFGLPDEYKQYILIGATLIAIVIIIIFFTRIKPHKLFPRICFGFIIGGAFGNIIDRIFGWILYKGDFKLFFERGVVDWIDMGIPEGVFGLQERLTWYTYNIADASITVSILLLLFYFIFTKDEEIFKLSNKDKNEIEEKINVENEEIKDDSDLEEEIED